MIDSRSTLSIESVRKACRGGELSANLLWLVILGTTVSCGGGKPAGSTNGGCTAAMTVCVSDPVNDAGVDSCGTFSASGVSSVSVDFGVVPSTEAVSATVKLMNSGTCEITIESVVVMGSTPSILVQGFATGGPVLPTEQEQLGLRLSAGQRPVAASLKIATDLPGLETVTVPVTAM